MNQHVSISRRSLVTASAWLSFTLLTTGRGTAKSSTRAEYDLIDLSPLFELGNSSADTLNNRRLVTGSCTVKEKIPPVTGYIWNDGQARLLSDLVGQSSNLKFPRDANDSNVIVGGVPDPGQAQDPAPAFRMIGPDFEALPLIGDLPEASAQAITEAGVIVGWAGGLAQASRAVIWRDGRVSFLEDHGANESSANGINSSGDIVGSIKQTDRRDAVIWVDGEPKTLPRFSDELPDQEAMAINDAGMVVGVSTKYEGNVSPAAKPWVWTSATASLTLLPVPEEAPLAFAVAMNQAGWVVGGIIPHGYTPFDSHAVLWRNGDPFELTSLLPAESQWTIVRANDINDRNEIAATAVQRGDDLFLHAVILIPRT